MKWFNIFKRVDWQSKTINWCLAKIGYHNKPRSKLNHKLMVSKIKYVELEKILLYFIFIRDKYYSINLLFK